MCDCFVCPQHFQALQFAILILVSVSTTCLGVMPPQQEKEESAQQFVQALHADGMFEADICCHLKGAGYKTGRVNKLLAATRASGSRDAAPEAEEAGLVLRVCVCVCLCVCACCLTRPERTRQRPNSFKQPLRKLACLARMTWSKVAVWRWKPTRPVRCSVLVTVVCLKRNVLSVYVAV